MQFAKVIIPSAGTASARGALSERRLRKIIVSDEKGERAYSS